LLAASFALLIVSTVARPNTLIGRILEQPPLRWLGQLSYSLYIWQTLLLQVPQVSFSRAAEKAGESAFLPYVLDLALITLLSIISNRFVETPLRNLGRTMATRLYSARPA
jgi:peptidoglycan/LPS O-acetylase OafA/YrhL